MAARCDSCGAYYRVGQLGDRYADISLATSIGISPTGGAGGRPCWDLGTGACAVADATVGSILSISVGCRFKLPALPSTNPFTLFALWESAGVVHDSARINTAGKLEVGRGLTGNVIGTGTQVVAANRWYYAEATIAISATVGTVRAVLWDDAGIRYDEIALASQNTRNGGTSGIVTRVYFGPQLVPGGFTSSAFMMDLYQIYGSNSWALGLLGPVRVMVKQTANDGFYSASTIAGSAPAATRWQSVNDVPSDEDVTVVQNVASTATKDTYGIAALTDEDLIWFVQPAIRAKASGSVSLTVVGRSAGVDGSVGAVTLSTAYKFFPGGVDTDPAHSGAPASPWTRKAVSASEWGWSVGATALTVSVTQVVLEVVLSDMPRQQGLLVADGFDDFMTTGTAAPGNSFVDGGGTSNAFSATGGVNGKVCLNSQINAPGAAYNVQPRYRIAMGFKFKYGQNPNQNWLPLCGVSQVVVSSTDKPQTYIGIGTTGKIEVRRGAAATDALLDNSQNAPTVATWHQAYVDIIVDGSGGAVLLKIDGTVVLNLTGLNTIAAAGTSNGRIDRVAVGSGATGVGNPWATTQTFGVSFDDWFVIDPLGGVVTSDPGFCTVDALMPAGAGALSGSTIAGSSPAGTRWGGVDEIPPDDLVTLNNFTAAGQEDLYALGPLSGIFTVFGIAVRIRSQLSASIAASGSGALYAVARLGAGGTDAIAAYSPKVLANTSFQGSVPKAFDADPAGNPWAYVTLASLQVGVRRTDNVAVNDNLTQLAVQVLRSDAVRSPPGTVVARAWVLS